MQKKILGSTDISVSPLGLGTVKFGRNQAVKFKEAFNLPSDQEILTLLGLSRDLGINLLDTAPAYGQSEERLGTLLENRQEWILMTKVGEEFKDGISNYNYTTDHTRFSIERSLTRLKTDYLDIVLIHSDGNDLYNLTQFGLIETLSMLKKQGKIRAFGVSSKTVAGGLMALEVSDCAMVTYNPIYRDEKAVITAAALQKKGIFIKKALMSGHIDKLPGEDPVQHAFKFILSEPGVSSIILGTINARHLQQAIDTINHIG